MLNFEQKVFNKSKIGTKWDTLMPVHRKNLTNKICIDNSPRQNWFDSTFSSILKKVRHFKIIFQLNIVSNGFMNERIFIEMDDWGNKLHTNR